MSAVGVDGCKAGWIAASDQGDQIELRVHRTFQELLEHWSQADWIMVDIPIGLPDQGQPQRSCDRLARQLLGPRASSVFSPPCRAAATAENIEAARALNLRALNRSLSAQAWGICRKIAEVDEVLRAHPDARSRVYEVHPEVCFWSLASGTAMQHPKKTAAGREERIQWLTAWEPQTPQLLQAAMTGFRRSEVQADDVLDALVALVTASSDSAALQSLPEQSEMDQQSLPMRMMYRSVQSKAGSL